MPIDPRMVKWDEAPQIDPRMVKWDEPAKAESKADKLTRLNPMNSDMGQKAVNYSGRDAVSGAVRGAGSIGATLLTPIDMAAKGLGVQNSMIGRDDRREGMDAALGGMGADTSSSAYQTNKLIAEIAGTAGIGGTLAKGAQAAKAAPSVVNGLRTGGLDVAGQTGLLGLLTRAGTGAATGAATAGAVDPKHAAEGALVGGLFPVAAAGAGKLGGALGQYNKSKSDQALAEFSRKAPLNQTIRDSMDAGYVIPPNMVNPNFKNQVVESISGKQATQQIASGKNEKVTGALVRKSLGIAPDAPISQSTLENLRKTAGNAYAEVSNISKQAADDLEALKIARNEAQGWFKAYNRSARPDDLAKAKQARVLSDSLETALEQHAAQAGKPELIPALRDARKQIAKTYTVGRAINDASGTIDARVLGRMHEKGLPLSDGLDTAGKFASAFPTVAKSSQQVGSQAAHNLKSLASLAMGVGGSASMGPVGAALATVPFIAPPVARAAMFRTGAQKALVQQAPRAAQNSALAELLMNQELQRLLAKGAPVASAQ